ncbi:MAG: sodium-dependent bicarbonate transport family permease [Verrucomicrobiota bacterium]
MNSILMLGSNLVSPPVVLFMVGILAAISRSDLRIPKDVYQIMTIYLLLVIGVKGGIAMGSTSLSVIFLPMGATLAMGVAIPLSVFLVTRKVMKMSVEDSAALGAHYGSVSAVTFMACLAFLDAQGISYEGFMPAVMAAMEIPAILVGVFLAKYFKRQAGVSNKETIRELLSSKSILLLVGGLVAGALASKETVEVLNKSLIPPFYGVLTIFLLEMGMIAGQRIEDVRRAGKPLLIFGLLAPVVQGTVAMLLAYLIGMSQGGAVIFAILCASASYIAAPAAVRAAIPAANPAYYVASSLGITFPFNLIFGIPLFFIISNLLYG